MELVDRFQKKSTGTGPLWDVWRTCTFRFVLATRAVTYENEKGVVKGGTVIGFSDVRDRPGKRQDRIDLKIKRSADSPGEEWLAVCAMDAATKANWLRALADKTRREQSTLDADGHAIAAARAAAAETAVIADETKEETGGHAARSENSRDPGSSSSIISSSSSSSSSSSTPVPESERARQMSQQLRSRLDAATAAAEEDERASAAATAAAAAEEERAAQEVVTEAEPTQGCVARLTGGKAKGSTRFPFVKSAGGGGGGGGGGDGEVARLKAELAHLTRTSSAELARTASELARERSLRQDSEKRTDSERKRADDAERRARSAARRVGSPVPNRLSSSSSSGSSNLHTRRKSSAAITNPHNELSCLAPQSREMPEDHALAKKLAEIFPQTGLDWKELAEEPFKFDPKCVQNARLEHEKEEQRLKKMADRGIMLAQQNSSMEQQVQTAAFEPALYKRMLSTPLVRGAAGDAGAAAAGASSSSSSAAAAAADPSALVFDCGTGETKCLKLTYSKDAAGAGTISLVELVKAPGVIDFLRGKDAGGAKASFLKDVPAGASQALSVDDFRLLAEQQLDAHPDVSASTIGTSAWARDPDYQEDILRLSTSLRRLGIVPRALPQEMEAVFESAAIAYAAEKLGVEGLTGNIGSGGGSVQFMKQFRHRVNMEIGHRKGMDRLAKAAAEGADPVAELAAWVADTVAPALDAQRAHAEEKLQGKVMAISACYYAASIAGVDLASENHEAKMHPASHVVKVMKAKLEELKLLAAADPACLKDDGDEKQRKKSKTDRMNLCNLTLQTILYENFLDLENCEICFKRDWLLPSAQAPALDKKGNPKPNFRTTWSAGWFLEHMRKQGAQFAKGPLDVLATLDASEHDTVIFDCGTAETKALKFSFKRQPQGGGDPGAVSFEEMKKAPGALDFLSCRYISETKDKKPKSAFIDYPEGAEPPSEMLDPKDFVTFAEQVVEQAGARRAIVGTSSWHRTDKDGKATSLMENLTTAGIICKKLRDEEEALYESAAVAYAAAKLGIDGIKGVIGSGGGSVQIVREFKDVIAMEVGFRAGMRRLIGTSKKGGDPLAELEAWTEDSVQAQLIVHGDGVTKMSGQVMAISACYYAASIAGVDVASKDDEATMFMASSVVGKMKAKLEQLKQQVRADRTCLTPQPGNEKTDAALKAANKARSDHAMNLCNLTLQTRLYETFLDLSTCYLCFKRNWVLPSPDGPEMDAKGRPKPNFRTTWSAGFYLHTLKKQGISWPASNLVLEQMETRAKDAKGTSSETEEEGMVDLMSIARGLLSKARQAEKKITPELRKSVKEARGRLLGDDDVAFIVSDDELHRKLIAKMDALLQQNSKSPSFVPTVADFTADIADCLRYVVVFEPDAYVTGVKCMEKFWAKKLSRGRFHSFSNFWHDKKGQSAHMGINAFMCTEPVTKGDPFTWALEFHTVDGVGVRNEEREVLRMLADPSQTDVDKFPHYVNMKKRWDRDIRHPPKAAWIGDPARGTEFQGEEGSVWQLKQRMFYQRLEKAPKVPQSPAGAGGDDDVRDRSESRSAGAKDRFISTNAANKLIVGSAKDAVRGIWKCLGIEEGSERHMHIISSCRGEAFVAIEEEFSAHSKEDLENKDGFGNDWDRFYYVAYEYAEQKEQGNKVLRDWEHVGLTLDNFCEMEEAEQCGLRQAHVLALRLYTSNSYARINGPLREGCSEENPHPFAATCYFIYDGLKKLRALGEAEWSQNASRGVPNVKKYFRGLAKVAYDPDIRQGCELACLSTSVDETEARGWAKTGEDCGLLLRLTASNWFNWGVDMRWLSMYAGEQEALFPPLTQLTYGTNETTDGLQVVEAEIQWPS